MSLTRHPKVYYWSVLASSVALSAVSTDSWAYAAQDIPEPVSPPSAYETVPGSFTAISSYGDIPNIAGPETFLEPKFSSFKTGPDLLGLSLRSTATESDDTATLVFPSLSSGIPQFSNSSSTEVSPTVLADNQTSDDQASDDQALDEQSAESPTQSLAESRNIIIESSPSLTPIRPRFSPSPSVEAQPASIETSETDVTVSEPSDIEDLIGPSPDLSQAVSSDQIEILNPTVGSVVDVPAITVIVRFPTTADIQLQVNSQAVNNDLIGRTESNPTTGLVTQTWYGVALAEGNNTITVVHPGDGSILQTTEVEVRGAPGRDDASLSKLPTSSRWTLNHHTTRSLNRQPW